MTDLDEGLTPLLEPLAGATDLLLQLRRSSSIAKLAEALAKAQGEILGAEKTQVNPHFKSRYADLAAVYDACRAPLAKHGIAVLQLPSADGPRVTVATLLAHGSGEWIGGALTMRAQQETPQGIGSCITYARRYALAAMAGVAPEDDDGNEASRRPVPPLVVETPETRPPAPPGAVYVDRLDIRASTSDGFQLADLLLSDGRPAFAKGNIIKYLEQVLQDNTPIVITTRLTTKGNLEITKAVRWKPPAAAPAATAPALPVEKIPF
jgi:hypothetical protein